MAYKWTDPSHRFVRRLADGACIPNDVGNYDFREVMEWVKAGNEIEESLEIPTEPSIDELYRDLARAVLHLTQEVEQIKADLGELVKRLAD